MTEFNFSSGTGGGYSLYQVRWGDHRSFERVVVEFREGEGVASAPGLPRMVVEKEWYPARVAIRLPGVPDRAKDIYTARHPFAKSRLLAGLDLFEPCGGGQFLALYPSRPLEYRIFTINSPYRLVVDVRPAKLAPSERVRFFLRTLPLYGDQVCDFQKAALDAGTWGRLLTDASGNTFGELGTFEQPEDAFNAKKRFRGLSERFSLVVKARGIMETPEVLP